MTDIVNLAGKVLKTYDHHGRVTEPHRIVGLNLEQIQRDLDPFERTSAEVILADAEAMAAVLSTLAEWGIITVDDRTALHA